MVTYVVLRSEVPGGVVVASERGSAVRRWHSTEVLAHRYSQPDQLQKALLSTLHANKKETPKTTRTNFIQKNFKKGLQNKKKQTNAAAVRNSTVVKTISTGPAINETVQRAEEDVTRALKFYQDTVLKEITDMLPGSATVVFDMVVSLTRAVDDLFSDKGPRLCELERALHHALANLVRWSDEVLLRGPNEPRETSVQSVVKGVEDATQALAELARQQERRLKTDEEEGGEAEEVSKTPVVMRTPGSCDGEEIFDDFDSQNDLSSLPTISTQSPSPPLCRRCSPTSSRSVSCHDNTISRPRSHGSSYCSRNSSPSNLSVLTTCSYDRLSHSLSSDSIVRQPEGGAETSVGSPLLRDAPDASITDSCLGPLPHTPGPFSPQGTSVCSQSLPPPLPPKQRSHIRSNSSSPQYNTVGHSNATSRAGFLKLSYDNCYTLANNSLAASLRARDSSDSGVGVLTGHDTSGHNGLDSADRGLRLSSASATNTSSPSQMSPASSLDSFNHDTDGSSLPHVSEDLKVDLASSVAVNCASAEFRPQSYSHLAEHFGHLNIGMNGSGRSESVHILQSHNYSRSKVCETHVHMESSSSVCYTQQLHRSSASYTRSSTSSSSSTLSSGSEGDTNSLTNVHSLSVPPVLPAKTRSPSVNSPLGSRVIDGDCSPDVPPKKGSSASSIQSSGYSGSNSSMQSNSSSNSSSSSGYHSSTSIEMLRHTIPESPSILGDQPPPIPPKKTKHVNQYVSLVNRLSKQGGEDLAETQEIMSVRCASFASYEHSLVLVDPSEPKPALPPKQKHRTVSTDTSLDDEAACVESTSSDQDFSQESHLVSSESRSPICAVGEEDHGVLEELSASKYILYKKDGDDGPNIKGGTPDVLLVHACAVHDGPLSEEDRAFQNAFVRTYRTFMTSKEVIEKLLYRYHKFSSLGFSDRRAQATALNAFSLLVCIVKDLTIADMETELLQMLSDFQYELLNNAEFNRAKLLRKELVFKLEMRKLCLKPRESLASMSVCAKQYSLLDFKAYEIAEQMTILDAELFNKVELPEALIWSREQSEELSPNLTEFTEHFNKMSFWARTKILEQGDAREREKYVRQFIKILKYLRKINNFNSYLALLSALDSAPVRRLEWQKSITDGLKEYCALIDSSSSFRAYRNALAESKPPCIPYIGLILQDLTFVNIGNSDCLPDGLVNFTKRWQQNSILENLSRFRRENYNFKRNEQIIAFFNEFMDSKNEDTLWEISKQIKPSGGRRCN
ncbi:Ras guanine-nucleotide exchange factors catalytic domain [Trinorchestia longiramus]|nr:Ras guanine-nucleotide exchange factors catalytic domain [Trinorchestia longiramus]